MELLDTDKAVFITHQGRKNRLIHCRDGLYKAIVGGKVVKWFEYRSEATQWLREYLRALETNDIEYQVY